MAEIAPAFVLPSEREQEKPKSPKAAPAFSLPSEPEQVSIPKDIGVGAVSGTQRGVYSLPETIQGLADIISAVPGMAVKGGMYGAEKLGLLPEGSADKYTAKMENIRKEAEERQKKYGRATSLPTTAEVQEASKAIGIPIAPRPKTPLGRITETAAEFVPAGLIGPGTMLEKGLISTGAGLSGGIGKEAFRGTPYEDIASFVASLPGALVGKTGATIIESRSPQAVQQRALDIAARVAQESVPDAAKTAARLENLTGAGRPSYLPEVKPTTPQLAREEGISGLATELQDIGGRGSAARLAQEDVSREAVQTGAAKLPNLLQKKLPQAFDLRSAYQLGDNPQGNAAINVNSMVSALEAQKDAAAASAWKSPALKGAGLFKERVVAPLIEYINELNPVAREAFPQNLRNMISAIANEPGPAGSRIDFQTLQDLRSLALKTARNAFNSENPVNAPDIYGFAQKIGDVMSDQGNVWLNNQVAIDAWNKARAATREYKEIFDRGFLADLVEEKAKGVPKISPEATLKKMLGTDNAAQNVRELRNVFGNAADQDIADFMVGKMTGNGQKLVTQDDVQKFFSDPKNASIINEIPNLRSRLQGIAQRAGESAAQAEARQFTTQIESLVSRRSPKALSDFISDNKDKFDRIFPDKQTQEFVDQLKNSADLIGKISPGKAVSTETLDKLTENQILSILYGRAIGAISDATIGALGGAVAAKMIGISGPAAPVVGAVALGTRSPQGASSAITSSINRFFFKNTQESAQQILQEAMQNPELMTALLKKPTPENITALDVLLSGAKKAPFLAEQVARPGYMQQIREDRAGRKSGGRTTASAAEALLRDLKRRKVMMANKTEQMLSLPDDAVVQALDAAKR